MKRRVDILLIFVMVISIFVAGCVGVEKSTSPPEPSYSISGSGGNTGGPLRIKRIELNFQNDRGEITVPLNSRLKAYAVIRFDGNGLFRASWVVDGRVLEEVAITVTYGNTLTIWTSSSTIIPTFEPGPHTLTLRIKEPKPHFKIPVIRYFVTGKEAGKQ